MAESSLTACAGLYVHVPFCPRKCPYCGFYSRPPGPGDFARYTASVLAHLRLAARLPEIRDLRFASVFFGGGTPSLLPVQHLIAILQAARQALDIADDVECSLEANPGTVDAASFRALRQAGFNRLSLGVQSLHDTELQRLGRIHTAAEVRAAVAAARTAGFENLNLDLMYGLAGQSPADWQDCLEQALTLNPDHLSLYELTPEEETPLALALERGELRLPEEEEVLTMMAITQKLLAATPLTRYEISNFARPGRECRHNVNYWENGLYLGLGPGAVSFFGGVRRAVRPGLTRYQQRALKGVSPWEEEERLDREAAFRESVVMGLRMIQGVSATALRARFGLDLRSFYGPTLDRLLAQEFLVWRGDQLALTDRGLVLANPVMAELV